MSEAANRAVASRQCGSCTLCCKLVGIGALEKPRAVWCRHCKPGKGCGIYETRPDECRLFHCGWLTIPSLGEDWRPERSKFLLTREAGGRLVIHCDPGVPSAWRREPYYAQIKAWAVKRANGSRQEIVILTGSKVTFLAPEGEYDLGTPAPDEEMLASYADTGSLVAVRLVPKAARQAGSRRPA
jgi:hypothetical protein